MKMNKSKSKLVNYIFLVTIFSLFFSHIIAIGYSNEVGITDGMYVNYNTSNLYNKAGRQTTITFSKTSDEIFRVEWRAISFIEHFQNTDNMIFYNKGNHQQILGRESSCLVCIKPIFTHLDVILDYGLLRIHRLTNHPYASW